MNWNVDHLADHNNRELADDEQGDPEGHESRQQSPVSDSMYAMRAVDWNENNNRWEPSRVFIADVGATSRNLHKRIAKTAKPLEGEERDRMLAFFDNFNAKMEQGPFNGFLYAMKDLLVGRICNGVIWMEHTEDIRASQERTGADPEKKKRTEDALERQQAAIQYYSRVLRTLEDEFDEISLTDTAWMAAAKNAAWDYVGSQKRRARDPERAKQVQVKRRTAEEVMFGGN